MTSNNYNQYGYPFQHSSAQHYPHYQTAPASNNATQTSRQYQPPATQAHDYVSYPAQSYAEQGSGYGASQNSSWHTGTYGATRETTNRAAEVLRNMSNTSYVPTSTSAASQASFTATNTVPQPHRYAAGASHSQQVPAPTRAPQPRTASVGNTRTETAGYSSQRAQTYGDHQQRPASPAKHKYYTTPASSARNSNVVAPLNQQYSDYNARPPHSSGATHSVQSATPSTSYNYTHNPIPSASIAPPMSSTTASDMYTAQNATTVDPTTIYDPWTEYRRKQEVMEAQKAAEDAARAEEERIAEEKRMEERKRKEQEERSRQPPPQQTKKAQKQQASQNEAASAGPEPSAGIAAGLEAEMRAMMAKMRELNGKDPALLARIWEEERKAKAPKSPLSQSKTSPPAQSAPTVPAAQPPVPRAADTRKKPVLQDPPNKKVARPAPATPATPAQPVPVTPVPVAQTVAAKPRPSANRAGGKTIWPPEKKAQLASAAVKYLGALNPGHPIDSSRMLSMLEGNPSYIELCEQLEQVGLKLDRAVFAKSLLTAVPDVNSTPRRASLHSLPVPANRPHVPPAILKPEVAASSPIAAPSPLAHLATPAPVAEMVPIKPELKPPANKEEAARKRNLSDLVDLTMLSDEDDIGPPPKRLNANPTYAFGSPHPHIHDAMLVDKEPTINNFPTTSAPVLQPHVTMSSLAPPPMELRRKDYVQALDKKKALRRNTYNPATIARDVLLACGRHPTERQLNQHLDGLRTTIPQIGYDSDLSTIRWDLIDPGKPPRGYFNDGIQTVTEDADDEDDAERAAPSRARSSAIGGENAASRVQALPEAVNPFKLKKRGRPPRHSLPPDVLPATPKHLSSPVAMSASVPRPSPSAAGVGYQAFRSATQYGPDGQPLAKKKGRPFGWRKAIHGSAAAQTRPANSSTTPSKNKPTQSSGLRTIRTNDGDPIVITSRSPSVASRVPRFQSFKCKWKNCEAELHNLETLKKHVFKVHQTSTPQHSLECLWGDCGRQVTSFDPETNAMIERNIPHSFDLASNWLSHIQQLHFDPLAWEFGDGPASGLSGNEDK